MFSNGLEICIHLEEGRFVVNQPAIYGREDLHFKFVQQVISGR